MRDRERFQLLMPILLLSSLLVGCGRRAGEDHEGHDDHDGHAEAPGHAEAGAAAKDGHADGAEAEGHDEHAAADAHSAHEVAIVQLTPEAEAEAGIRTAPAERRALPAVLETTGRVDFDANRLAHVSPRISGRAHAVLAGLGNDIKAGAALAVVDSIELGQAKAAFARARAQHDLSRRNYEREKGLLADRISSEREVLAAEASLREAAADHVAAEQSLHLYGLSDSDVDGLRGDDPRPSLYTVRAPLAGRVVEKHVTLGELVTPERNLFTIADLSRVWIWIDVYERDLRQVHVDDGVEVELDAYPDASFQGTVSYLSDQVDADTRTVRARVDVPNPDGRLRPGSFAKVRVTDPHAPAGAATVAHPVVVPASAVQRDGDESVVFVATGDRRYERREVTSGRRASGLVEVLTGVTAGESVVVAGAFLLKSEVAKETMGGGHSH